MDQIDERKISEMVYLYEAYEKKLNEMMAFKESIERNVKEYENIISSLDVLEKNKGEVILPLSSIAFLPVEKVYSDKLLVMVGSNIIVEMNYKNAKSYFSNLKEKLEKEISKFDKEIDKLAIMLEELKQQLSQYGVV